MKLHAFVAMPFGTKQGTDFNDIYNDYIRPGLEQAGFEVVRADEELRSGDIRVDMFQELLLADLVVVDLSIDNPNVWYELGVRHALRPRGVVQIQSQREYMPLMFMSTERCTTICGTVTSDPDRLDEDRKMLATVASETVHSWRGRRIARSINCSPFWSHRRGRACALAASTSFGRGTRVGRVACASLRRLAALATFWCWRTRYPTGCWK